MFTYFLVILNVIVFILIRTNKVDLDDLTVSYHTVYNLRQPYRIVTAAFAHYDPLHLFFNMSSLLNVGGFVYDVYGPVWFIIIYLAAMIPGKILSLQIRHNRRDDYSSSLGASTAICGLLGAYFMVVLFHYGSSGLAMLYRPILSFILMSVLPGVDGTSHVCGLAAGMAAAWLRLMVF